MKMYYIIHKTENDDNGNPLVWSTEFGFRKGSPDLFTPKMRERYLLPLDGEWAVYSEPPGKKGRHRSSLGKRMKFTLISGDPRSGYVCYGIFDTAETAHRYRLDSLSVPDDCQVIFIEEIEYDLEEKTTETTPDEGKEGGFGVASGARGLVLRLWKRLSERLAVPQTPFDR